MTHRIPVWLLVFASLAPTTIFAQPPAVVPLPTLPQVPTLNPVAPSGMTRGTTLELALTGTNLDDPLTIQASFPVQTMIPTDANNGKDPTKIRIKLTVPADAPIGLHTLAIVTKRGISNAISFCLDDLPQVIEVDTNRTRMTPQIVAVPSVIVGRADTEVSDFFQFTVTANQRLSFEVIGHRLGSPIDPVIRIHSIKTGKELPGVYADDSPGAQTDTRLTYTFKEAGNYAIEVHDQQYRGGPNFFYRLRIGDFPIAIAAYPMGVQRGQSATVAFAGPLVTGTQPIAIPAITDGRANTTATPKFTAGGASGWPVDLFVTDSPQVTDMEPNNDPATAQKLTLPVNVTGRFLERGDLDVYSFALTKGQKLKVTAQTYEVLSPTEVYLTLKNAAGVELVKSNPQQATTIEYTAPEAGTFTLTAEHLNYVYGPNEIYYLTLSTGQPDFSIKLGTDRVTLAPGTTTMVPVLTQTRSDLAEPIELSIIGPAGVSGSVTIPTSMVAPAPNLPLTLMPVTVAANVAPGGYPLRIEAKAMVAGKPIIRDAEASETIKARFAGLTFPPRTVGIPFAVGVTAPDAFTLTARITPEEVARTVPATLTISVVRTPAADGEIALTLFGLPPTVTATLKPIAKGTNEVAIPLTAAIAIPEGRLSFAVRGQTKAATRDVAVISAPIGLPISLPLSVTIEPMTPIALKIGQKTTVKVKTVRKGGYAGPIVLEVRNLPANVTATKPTIAPGQTDASIELTAASNAVVGDKLDVNILATAPAAANQTAATPNFTLKLGK